MRNFIKKLGSYLLLVSSLVIISCTNSPTQTTGAEEDAGGNGPGNPNPIANVMITNLVYAEIIHKIVESGEPIPSFSAPMVQPDGPEGATVSYQFISGVTNLGGPPFDIPLPPAEFSINQTTGEISVDESYSRPEDATIYFMVEVKGAKGYTGTALAFLSYTFAPPISPPIPKITITNLVYTERSPQIVASGDAIPGFSAPEVMPGKSPDGLSRPNARVSYRFTRITTAEEPSLAADISLPPIEFSINPNTGEITADDSYLRVAGSTLWLGVEATGSNGYSGSVKKVVGYTFGRFTATLAGSGDRGSADGIGTNAQFNRPQGIAVDSAGNVYVGDRANHLVRKISPTAEVSTLDNSAMISRSEPTGVAVDTAGNVYVADYTGHRIRKISPTGMVSILAGSGQPGSLNGTGTGAQFNNPQGVAVDSAGNVYVADRLNHRIRKISPTGVVTTLAGSSTPGSANGTGAAAQFNNPIGVAVDSLGNVYVGDTLNHLIRKITPDGVVTSFAGSGIAGSANGTGAGAEFNQPQGLAVDPAGNVYVADSKNNLIRKISPTGEVTTLVGTGASGSDDGLADEASFNNPTGVAIDRYGKLYVADFDNNLIRYIIQ